MPLIDSQPEFGGEPARFPQTLPEDPGPKPSALDVMGSAERTSNLVGQAYDRFVNHPKPDDAAVPGFNPIDHIPAGYLHDYGEKFMEAQNPAQVQWIKERIDDERVNQGIVARGGGWGTAAAFAAGTTDPLNVASMALFPEASATRIGNALRWATTNAAVTAGQEAIGSQLSATRTPGESLLNIGAGAVLGGLLGSVARRLPAGQLEQLRTRLAPELKPGGEEDLLGRPRGVADPYGPVPEITPPKLAEGVAKEPVPEEAVKEATPEEHALPGEPTYVNPEGVSTAGAMQVEDASLKDLTVAKGAQLYSRTIDQTSLAARILNQPSVEARKTLLNLADIKGTLEGNWHGMKNPESIENHLLLNDGIAHTAMAERTSLYKDYAARVSGDGEPAMSRAEFEEAAAKAMRRGDKSDIPEVAKAAAASRARVIQPLWERAGAAGIQPEEAKLHAESYQMRMFDQQKINADKSGWLEMLRRSFIKQGVDAPEALDLAYKADLNVRGSERGQMDWHALDGVVPKSGRLKARTLALPDTDLEPYLVNDLGRLERGYLHTLGPEVEMTERFGSRDLKDQFSDIHDEFARFKEQARAVGDTAKFDKLDAQEKSTVENLKVIRDRLYGIHGVPEDPSSFHIRAGRLIRAGNVTMLGSATLSHFSDIPNAMLRYGVPKTMHAMAAMLTNLDTLKMGMRQAQKVGAALDMSMNVHSTSNALWNWGSESQFAEQKVARAFGRGFTMLTGETPFITFTQAMTSTLAQDEILRVAEKLANKGDVSDPIMARLASAGLDRGMLSKIHAEGKINTHTMSGLRFGMSDIWKDRVAARAFDSAVVREAHSVTLRPGAADLPRIMTTETGRLLGQFSNFAFAMSRTVVTPLLQNLAHGDARAAGALLALISAGTLRYYLKQKASGEPIEKDPAKLAAEVADGSNLLGWTSRLVMPALHEQGFQSSDFLGPSFERGMKTGHEISRLANQKVPFGRADVHFLRQMTLGNGPFYMRRGIDALEDKIGDAYGLPGESIADRQAKQAANQ